MKKKSNSTGPFKTAAQLQKAAHSYFEWCEANPPIAEKVVGEKVVKLRKIRPFTIGGLCTHLKISRTYFQSLKAKKSFADTVDRIENVIYVQLFEGAAVGFFNADLVIRYLQLADHREINLNVTMK